ncbi:hypothetical protein KAU11_10990, partial [Candidatus Babeliales bacterium]|nr:hypothetical protein [Candidatus Babeliales bacterium]
MATLTGRALSLQRRKDAKARKKKEPTPQVLGASTTGELNAAQIGGARGIGFETPEDQEVLSGIGQATSEQGQSMSQAGDAPAQSMSAAQANHALRGAGLSGMVDPSKYVGMNPAAAQRAIAAEKAKRTGQVSQNTSFAFNPETISGTKKIVDRVGIGINDISSQSWDSKGTQADNIKATIDASAKQIAALFQTQEEYNNAVASNPQLQQTLATFEKLGGNAQDIAGKIATPVTEQTTGDYLANLSNPEADPLAQEQALNELIPEKELIQAEIARNQQIPEDMMSLYFGTEDQVGLIEMKKNQAIEEKRIIEEQEQDDKLSIKSKAKLAIKKGRAELKIQTSKIEENRLAAKNYMTGMLAKLGALKTTGAAPLALQTLDTKYEISKQTLDNQYKYAEQEIEIQLDDALNNLENETDLQILNLEQDLTKDYEDITKEVMKLQQAADKKTYELSLKYATELRKRTTVYTKELKKAAEAYAKSFAKTAGGGLDLKALSDTLEGDYVAGKGVLNPLGGFNELNLTNSQEREVANSNLQGTDAVKYFVSLPPAERRLVSQEAISTGRKMTLSTIRSLIEDIKKKPEPKKTETV